MTPNELQVEDWHLVDGTLMRVVYGRLWVHPGSGVSVPLARLDRQGVILVAGWINAAAPPASRVWEILAAIPSHLRVLVIERLGDHVVMVDGVG